MTEPEFWDLIDRHVRLVDGAVRCEKLVDHLAKRDPRDIARFGRWFDAFHAGAYRFDLWGAAYAMCGGCSDDGFAYFRAWLIAHGERVYRRVLAQPDLLVEIADDSCDGEALMYVANEAFERATGGGERPRESFEHDETLGPDFDFDDEEEMARRYPRLLAWADARWRSECAAREARDARAARSREEKRTRPWWKLW